MRLRLHACISTQPYPSDLHGQYWLQLADFTFTKGRCMTSDRTAENLVVYSSDGDVMVGCKAVLQRLHPCQLHLAGMKGLR